MRKVNRNEIFGENVLLGIERRTEQCVANSKVIVYKINGVQFNAHIGHWVSEWIQKRNKLYSTRIDLNDLSIVKVLGQGS